MVHLDPWTSDFDTEWKTVDYVVHQGLMPLQNLTGASLDGLYWDICMKLDVNVISLSQERRQDENLPLSRSSHNKS